MQGEWWTWLALFLSILLLLIGCSPNPAGSSGIESQPIFFDPATGEALAASWSFRMGTLEASAEGYLPRIQPLAARVAMWREQSNYLDKVVYRHGRLIRRTSPIIIEDRTGEVNLAHVSLELHRLTGLPTMIGQRGNLTLFWGTPPAGYRAFSNVTFEGNILTHCEIGFGSQEALQSLWHELGHCLGLDHSPDRGDTMYGPPYGWQTYSPREERILTMMYRWRKPGNEPPDRER